MRVRSLPFLPTSVNFSSLPELAEESLHEDYDETQRDIDIDKEIMLLKALKELDSDKERCALFFEILREYGWQIDYGSAAKALKINLRWYMRVKKNIKKKVLQLTVNE